MNFKRIFLISIIMLVLTMGVVSANELNDTQEMALDDVSDIETTDIDQELGEFEGIDIAGPDELYYETYLNRFDIHTKSGCGDGSVYSYVNNQSKTYVNIYNSSQDEITPIYVEIEREGTYDIEFRFLQNGYEHHIASFKYNADKFRTSISCYSNINYPVIDFDVDLPVYASGKVNVTINNRTYSGIKEYGSFYVELSCTNRSVHVGKNPATVVFTADSKSEYKSQTSVCDLIVLPTVDVDWITRYGSDDGIEMQVNGLSGKFTYVLDGQSITVDVTDQVRIPLGNLSLGKHSFRYSYDFGDVADSYEGYDLEVVPNVKVPAFVRAGNESYVVITLPDDVNGNLTVYINDIEVYKNDCANSTLSIPLTNLQKSNSLVVNYSDDSVQYREEFPITFTNNSPNWDMKLDIDDWVSLAEFSDNNQFTLNTPDDYDGDITVFVDGVEVGSYNYYSYRDYGWDGKNYVNNLNKAYYMFNVDSLKIGKHIITVVANNSQYYMPVNRSATFTATNIFTYFSDDICLESQNWGVELPHDATGSLKFYLDDKLIDTQKGSGISFWIPENTKFGEHTLKLVYTGDKKYPKESISKKVTYTYRFFPRYKNWLFFNDEQFVVGNKNILTFEGPSTFNGKVTLTIAGEKITITPKRGYAEFDLSKFKAGNYTAKVEYSGSGIFTKQSYNMDIEILPKVADIKVSNVNVYYDSGSLYTVKVLNMDGSVAKNFEVIFYLNGVTTVKKTDSNGIAKFKIAQKPGTYSALITCKYSQVTKKITVKHVVTLSAVKVKKSAKKLTLTATLKSGKTPLKNKKVTFKFNGKKYSGKTNSKGIAKVTIKKSVLKKLKVGKKVTYQAIYKSDSVKKTVKILK